MASTGDRGGARPWTQHRATARPEPNGFAEGSLHWISSVEEGGGGRGGGLGLTGLGFWGHDSKQSIPGCC
jgi:hypothetical protein